MAPRKLTRPWNSTTERSESDLVGKALFVRTQDNDRQIVDAVEAVAKERGVPMAQIALAWVLRKPEVTSPIIGATKPKHIDDAVAALDIELTDDEVRRLEEPYQPHPVMGLFGMPPAEIKLTVRT